MNLAGTTLSLGIVPPFLVFPLGLSDMNGDLSTSFDLPSGIDGAFLGQSLGIEFAPPMIGFCTSNVATFML